MTTIPFWSPVVGLERSRQLGAGHVFFVHAWLGNNDNSGISPNEPFETITHALSLCGDDIHDYIIVMSSYAQEPAWPITVPVTHRAVHFVGLGSGTIGASLYPGVTDEPAIYLDTGAINCEIAGLNMGGGATHGCIEIGSCQKTWIHHNHFGNQDQLAGNLPAYGVHAPTGAAGFMVCEDNVFWGDQCNVGQGISINGIEIQSGAWMTIRRNRIMGCTVGIQVRACTGSMITENFIVCPDVLGAAINLVAHANTTGCMITNNVAMEGAETAMAANPFRDNNALDINHWGMNKCTLAGGIELNLLPA